MKQIERKGSPQRLLCELLEKHPDSTINDLSEQRGVHFRCIARQVKALIAEGLVQGSGHPCRYRRTSKPLPAVVLRTPKSETEAERRKSELAALCRRQMPTPTDLDRVFAQWRRAGDSHA